MGGAAVRGRVRIRGRRPAGAVPERSDLAFLAVRAHELARPRVEDAAEPASGLAGRLAARAHRAGAAPPGGRGALVSPAVLSGAAVRLLVAGDRRGAGDGAGRRDADQDLEQRADRTST